MTDAVLLDKWRRERDAEAFRELASRYSAMVYATCLRVLRNPQEAEEAAQECFERLAQAPRLDAPYAGPWLHRVATNRALDRLRVEGRRRTREDRYARERDTALAPEWDDIYPLVDEAIAGLPEELRVPLVRHFLENRTHEAIALELGVSRTAITYRLQRGLERVRRNLKRRGVEVASTAFATLLAEKMAEAAVVPATLEAALGCLAVAGLKVAPVTAGGASALLGGLAVKMLIGAAATVVAAGFAWHMLAPTRLSPVPAQSSVARSVDTQQNATRTTKASLTGVNPAPITATSAQATQEGGVITGRVYDAKTGRGIPGVKVLVECREQSRPTADTDANGVYRIAGLSAGTHSVSPGWPVAGYSPSGSESTDTSIRTTVSDLSVVEGIDFALQPSVPVSGHVVLADGKPAFNASVQAMLDGRMQGNFTTVTSADGSYRIDMPEPREDFQIMAQYQDPAVSVAAFRSSVLRYAALPPEGLSGVDLVLTEALTASAEGKALFPDGKPAVGYSIILYQASTSPLYWTYASDISSDGVFKLSKLAAGTYSVAFHRPDQTSGPPYVEEAQLIVETGQPLRGLELHVQPARDLLSISGRVVDGAGRGIAQSRVHIWGDSKSFESVTDGQGAFTLSGLRGRSYSVQAHPPDALYSPTDSCVVEAGTEGLVLVMGKGGRIEGRVVSARDGKVVPRFETYLYQMECPEFSPVMLLGRQDVNNPEGKFVRSVYAGPNTVIVKAPRYAAAWQVVHVTDNHTVTGLEFRLEPAKECTGKVVDEEGAPIADVGIYEDRESPIRLNGERQVPQARTNADGLFSMELLSPQVSQLIAYHPQYAAVRVGIEQRDKIVLQKGGMVKGRVTLAGQQVEGCSVRVASGSYAFRWDVLSKQDGSYRLGPFPVGTTVRLVASLQERRSAQSATVEAGGTSSVDFAFPADDACLEGSVTLSGKPVAGAPVSLFVEREAAEEFRDELTDASGHYRFSRVPSGTARLILGCARGGANTADRRVELELEPGETMRQDFVLDCPGIVAGKVAAATHDWHVMAILLRPDAQIPFALDQTVYSTVLRKYSLGMAECADDGTFEFTQVPPGDYLVLALLQSRSNSELFADERDCIAVHVDNGPVSISLAPR